MNATPAIRVLILPAEAGCDTGALTRLGWRVFLGQQPGIHVLEEGPRCPPSDPGSPLVALLHLAAPCAQLGEPAHQLLEGWLAGRVIVLVDHPARPLLEQLLQAGVTGILPGDVSGEELLQAVRHAAAGQPTLTAEAVRLLVQPAAEETRQSGPLNPRELEVLPLLAHGLNNHEIAARLGVSHSTILQRIRAIFHKLGATNRTQAVAIAIQRHLLG